MLQFPKHKSLEQNFVAPVANAQDKSVDRETKRQIQALICWVKAGSAGAAPAPVHLSLVPPAQGWALLQRTVSLDVIPSISLLSFLFSKCFF